MNEYCGVHLNLMEVVPVYLVSHSVDVNVMMYLLKKRALRDGLIDEPCNDYGIESEVTGLVNIHVFIVSLILTCASGTQLET